MIRSLLSPEVAPARRRATWARAIAALAAMGALWGGTEESRAQTTDTGALLIADMLARPASGDGTLFLQPLFGDSSTVYIHEAPLAIPYSVDFDPAGVIYVLDRTATDPEGGTGVGAIFGFNSVTRELERAVYDDRFERLSDLDQLLDGRYLVVDEDAGGDGGTDAGTVFVFDPLTGAVDTWSTAPELVDPVGVHVDSLGSVYVMDRTADPDALGGQPGAIFELDPGTGALVRVVATSPDFVTPMDAVRVGSFLHLADRDALDRDGEDRNGAVFRVDLATGEVTRYLSTITTPPAFVNLVDIEFADGIFYILDRDATFVTGEEGHGGIYRIDPDLRIAFRFESSSLWRDPNAIALFPNASVRIVTHEIIDLNGAPLTVDDPLRVRVELESLVSLPSTFTVIDTVSSFLDADPESAVVSLGTLSVSDDTTGVAFSWVGEMPPSGTATFEYDAVLTRTDFIFDILRSRVELEDDTGGRTISTLGLETRRGIQDTDVVFADRRSFFQSGYIGVKTEADVGFQIVLDGPPLLNPTSVELDGRGGVFICDRDADVDSSMTFRGAVFRYDPVLDSLAVVSVAPGLIDPVDVAILPNENLAVLDASARAVFEIHRSTGTVLSTTSDPRFVAPSDLTVTVDGEILIVDREANPFGLDTPNTGAVFRISAGGSVTVDSANDRYIDPVGIALITPTSYFVADWSANPGGWPGDVGTVFTAQSGSGPVVYATGPPFRNPTRVAVSREGDLLVSDSAAPALFVVNADREVTDFIDNDDLLSPEGIAVSPVSRFVGSRYVVNDLDGGRVVGGDDLEVIIEVINTGNLADDPVSLVSNVPEEFLIDVGSLSASSGPAPTYDAGLRQLDWAGPVSVGQTVEISYLATVDPDTPTGSNATNSATITSPGTVEPYSFEEIVRVLGPFLAGDLLLLDFGYRGESGERGAVFRRNLLEGGSDFVVSDPSWRLVRAIATDTSRRAVIVDQLANPSGLPGLRGAIYRYDGALDSLEVVSQRSEYAAIVDIVIDGDRVFVLDRDANFVGDPTLPGAIIELDLDTNTIVKTFTGPDWFNPIAMARDTDGRFLVLDQDANPLGGDGRGTLFLCDFEAETSIPIAESSEWVFPTDVLVNTDGAYLVCDASADPLGSGLDTGAVYAVDPSGFEVSRFSVGNSYRSPYGLSIGPQDEVLVVDEGTDERSSLVWRVTPVSGIPTAFWIDPEFVAGRAIAVLDRPFLQTSSFEVTDVDGFPVESSDVLDYRFVLRNVGDSAADDVDGSIVVSERGTLDAGSVTISTGSFVVSGSDIVVETSVQPHDSTTVEFRFTLDDALEPGTSITTTASLSAGNGVGVSVADVRRTPRVFLPDDFIVLDQLVPAAEYPTGLGTLFRWDGAERRAEPYTTQPLFRWLQSLRLDPLDPGILHVVDALADPFGFGRSPGAVWELSVDDGRLLRTFSSPDFTFPTSAFSDANGDLVVVDPDADPFGTGEDAGALFGIDRDTGAVTTLFTHPSFSEPRDGALLPDGTFLIVDEDADPRDLGGNVGTLFHVDPVAGTLEVFASGGFLVDPVAVTGYTGGSYLIVDHAADPSEIGGDTATIFQYVPGSTVDPFIMSPLLKRPRGIKVGDQDEVYVVDAAVDPNGPALGSGAILRYHPSDGLVTVYAWSDAFRIPLGIEFLESPTPVDGLYLQAESRADGSIALDWQALVRGRIARFDVLRAPVRGDTVIESEEELLTADGLAPDERAFVDVTPERGATYGYRVRLTEANGDDTISGLVRATSLVDAPPAFRLVGGAPNPFRGSTALSFEVPASGGKVRLLIFDVGGRRVAELANGSFPPGRHVAEWGGSDHQGRRVAPGVYFYRMEAPGFSATRRLVSVR